MPVSDGSAPLMLTWMSGGGLGGGDGGGDGGGLGGGGVGGGLGATHWYCLLYTSPSPRDS